VAYDAEFRIDRLDSPSQNLNVLLKAVKVVLVQRVGESDVVNIYRRNVTSNERVGKTLVTHLWYVSLNLRLCAEMLARISLRGFLAQKKAKVWGDHEYRDENTALARNCTLRQLTNVPSNARRA